MNPSLLDRNNLYGLLAILSWSTTVAFSRSLTEQIGPLTSGAAVYLLGGLFLLVRAPGPAASFSKVRHLPRLFLLGCGALFCLYMFSFFQAVGRATDRSQVLEVGMVNYLWPSLTILFSLLLLRRKASLLLVPGTLLALAGVFLVLNQGGSVSWDSFSSHVRENPIAYLMGLTAALSWGLYSNLTRRWAGPDSDGAIPFFMLGTGFLLLSLRLLTHETSSWQTRTFLELVFLSLATALGYLFWDLAMRRGDVVLAAVCSYFTPLLSTGISCLYLGVSAGWELWIGCLAVVAGSLLSWRAISERVP